MLRPPVLILLAVGLAFAVRLAAVAALIGFAAPPKREANPDQIDYELFAAQMAAGHGFAFAADEPTACRPPGTSLTLLPVYAAAGRSFAAGRVWFCLLGAATVGLTWLLAARAFGPWPGALAALLLAVYPGHWYYSLHFLSEVPFAFYLAAAVLLGLVAADRRPVWAVPCGLAWGMTVLTRPNMALGVGLVALLWLLAGGRWRDRAVRAGLLLAAAGAVVGPWLARNQAVVGKPAFCTIVGGYTFWGAHNDRTGTDPALAGYWVACSELADAGHPLRGSEVEREDAAWRYGKAWVAAHPDRMPGLTLHKLGRVLLAYSESSNRAADLGLRGGWLAAAPFVLAGVVIGWRRHPAATRLLLVPFAATLLTAVVFYGCGRFRDGVMPTLAAFAGLAAATGWRRLRPGTGSPLPG